MSWSDLDKAQMRALYSKLGAKEMGRRLSRNEKSVQSQAHRMGLRVITRYKNPVRPELQDTIDRDASSADGLSVCALPRDMRDLAGKVICSLVRQKRLFRAKISHKVVRYFSTQEAADAYLVRTTPARPKRDGPYVPVWQSRARWDRDAEPIYPEHPDGSPAYKITVAPAPRQPTRTNTHGVVG